MTGPLSGGGKTFTLPIDGDAVLLTETAVEGVPMLVINTSANDLVYLGNSSGVSPASGVPLEAGTALPWIAGGEVWAVVAPGTTNTIAVVITSAIAGWEPSPAAIAAAVAAELLAEGIPNVLVENVIFSGTLASLGQTTLDVSGYASVVIAGDPTAPIGTATLRLQQSPDPVQASITDVDTVTMNARGSLRLGLSGHYLNVANLSAVTAVQITVVGSNRPPLHRLDTRTDTATGDRWSAAGPFAAGTVYPLAQLDPLAQLNNEVFLDFHVNGAVRGDLLLQDANGNRTILALNSEVLVFGAGMAVTKRVAVTQSAYSIWFSCTTLGGAGTSVVANLVPL